MAKDSRKFSQDISWMSIIIFNLKTYFLPQAYVIKTAANHIQVHQILSTFQFLPQLIPITIKGHMLLMVSWCVQHAHFRK